MIVNNFNLKSEKIRLNCKNSLTSFSIYTGVSTLYHVPDYLNEARLF